MGKCIVCGVSINGDKKYCSRECNLKRTTKEFKHCLNCGVKFHKTVNTSATKWEKKKFCKLDCRKNKMTVKVIQEVKTCKHCSQRFTQRIAESNVAFNKRVCCSRSCANEVRAPVNLKVKILKLIYNAIEPVSLQTLERRFTEKTLHTTVNRLVNYGFLELVGDEYRITDIGEDMIENESEDRAFRTSKEIVIDEKLISTLNLFKPRINQYGRRIDG